MKRRLLGIAAGVLGGYGFFQGASAYGQQLVLKKLETQDGWQNLSADSRHRLVIAAAQSIPRIGLEPSQVRELLPDILDAAKVPHGDMAVPSKVVHSRRYLISQWQRAAVGACVIVIGTDEDGDICIAVGSQRGQLRHPQGYMELPLPKEDLTGLRIKKASRINAQTGEAVPADVSIEANAVREVHEEIGLTILESQLKLLEINSAMDSNPVAMEAKYYVVLPNTPGLKTLDQEFAEDDLSKPQWVKVKNIICSRADGKYYAHEGSLPFDMATVKQLNATLKTIGKTEVNGFDHREHLYTPQMTM